MKLAGVLLAAGAARRFGGPKLLESLPDGTPLGVAAARALRRAVPRALAVVRPEDHRLGRALRAEGLTVIPCPRAHHGMGHSLAAGVRASADAGGWLIALGDMPFVRWQTMAAVARALNDGAPIALPSFRGRQGHPVGFGAEFGSALAGLTGDTGARTLLQTHAARVHRVPCEDSGIIRDVDTAADLARHTVP